MRIAIAQPTYLPWLGYFDLIDQVDLFVLLDSVQFEKQSWQQRNRIKTPTGLQLLTVPVVFRGRLGQRIKDVEIREIDFSRDHLRAIELNYKRSPFFDVFYPRLSELLRAAGVGLHLVDLNLAVLKWMLGVIGIATPLVRSSELDIEGKRTALLACICRALSGSCYLSPIGSAAYLLEEIRVMKDQGVDVLFHSYQHPEYRQLFPPFQAYASVIDLLFNEGPRALEVIRSGRRPPLLPYEAAALLRTGLKSV